MVIGRVRVCVRSAHGRSHGSDWRDAKCVWWIEAPVLPRLSRLCVGDATGRGCRAQTWPRRIDGATLIENRLIVCIASSWELDPTSKHHLMRVLSRRNDVVWVSYHGSRRPRFNRADRGSLISALRRVASGVRPINERMVQITPFVLPGAPGRWREVVNRLLLVSQIRRVIDQRRRSSDQPVQIWTFAPDVAYLAGAFNEECLVYYCVDEFSKFEGFSSEAVAAAERRLISAADLVITSSSQLRQSRAASHPHVYLVRHGVDHSHFTRALPPASTSADDHAVPQPIRHIPRPRAGFIGLVQHWFDIRLLRDVARMLPEVSFVIVGESQVDVSSLAELDNVHLVGRQPYESLPAYCAAFDLGLIPFVRSPMTDNVNPIKLREYLAAGLPVVSTSLPEVQLLAPHVLVADDAPRFAAACRQAIATDSLAARRLRSESIAGQSWEAVAERVSRLVAGAIGEEMPRDDLLVAPLPVS